MIEKIVSTMFGFWVGHGGRNNGLEKRTLGQGRGV
jgi:hypothetical protein